MNEVSSEQEQAERDRLRSENQYLLSRFVETHVELKATLVELAEALSGLQSLEKVTLMKAKELANRFQVSENRVYELVRTQGLPVVVLGDHQYRFDPVAVRRWLDQRGKQQGVGDGVAQSDSSVAYKSGLRAVRS